MYLIFSSYKNVNNIIMVYILPISTVYQEKKNQ